MTDHMRHCDRSNFTANLISDKDYQEAYWKMRQKMEAKGYVWYAPEDFTQPAQDRNTPLEGAGDISPNAG